MNNILGWMHKFGYSIIRSHYLLWIVIGLSLYTCQQSSPSFSPREQLSKLLLDQHLQGDSIPLPDSLLLKYLPIHLTGYLKTNHTGQTFHSPYLQFSYAERIYHGRNRLSISIGDYVGDTTTFLGFWDRYEVLDAKHTDRFHQSDPFMFGWTEIDTTRQTITRYVALSQRFWIEIKLNSQQGLTEHQTRYKQELAKTQKAIEDLRR